MEGPIARKAGGLIARKIKEDLSIGLNDIYIAATAIVEGEKLVILDKSDFKEIKELETLDWEDF